MKRLTIITTFILWILVFSPMDIANAYGNGFNFSRAITIDNTKVSNTDQTDFTVLVSDTASYLKTVANGGYVANSSGYDIGFYTSSDCSTGKMSWETETYSPTTGEINFWVKVASLSSSVDTVFYMCYGNSSVTTDQSDPASTWDSNFKAVWHLPDGANLSANDSSSSNRDGTLINTPTAVSGKIGGAGSFASASSERIDLVDDMNDGDTSGTFSAWINTPTNTQQTLFCATDASYNEELVTFGILNGASSPRLYSQALVITQYNDAVATPDNSFAINTWVHVAVTANGSTYKIYLNGVEQTLTVLSFSNSGRWLGAVTPNFAGASKYYIGYCNTTYPNYLNSKIDAMKLSNSVRSSDWIKTEYNNQSATSTFYSIGAASYNTNSTKIRQEINILNGYFGSASGAHATSSSLIRIDTAAYTSETYYLEVVASTTSAVSSNMYLKNAITFETVATVNFSNSNTYTRYRSTSFTPTTGSNEYVLVSGNEAVQKGVIAARVVVLQSEAPLVSTETQIEIGNNELAKNNTTSSALTNPKYWYYDSTKWDGSKTFNVEVSYKTNQYSSTTVYTTPGTFTYTPSTGETNTVVELWGAGGAGGVIGNSGGGGGGGGAYARSTTTTSGNVTLVVAATNAADTTTSRDSTWGTTIVVADGGTGTNSATAGAGGTLANTVGDVKFAGGAGSAGNNTGDSGGGGGSSAGPEAGGNAGTAANTTQGGAGASCNALNGGATGGAADINDATAPDGGTGGSNVNCGAGGGGGDNGDFGGNGGSPGGGGGGGEITGGQVGARGQARITAVIGSTGIALEEDNGSFGGWTFKKQIVTAGVATSTPDLVSVSFTPTTGRNYRIVASTTNANASYDIYNAKVVVDQTYPTFLEPQYLLANTLFSSGTSLQNFLTYYDPAEWTTGNTYSFIHEGNSVSGGTSDIKIQNTSGPTDISGSTITDVIEREQSSAMTMPGSAATLDVIATSNNSNLYASRILVQVTYIAPADTVPDAPTGLDAVAGYGKVNLTWVTPASDGGDTITGYKLYRDTTTSPTTLIGTLGVVNSYTDGAITNGTLYYYRVVATNAIGDSVYSNEDSATPINAPASSSRSNIKFIGPFMKFIGGRVRFQ